MLERFRQFITEQHLVPSGGEVLLAVSGGRDSVCMAHLFSRAGIPFAMAHCNFRLRPGDSDRDQAFVRRLAEDYGVRFFTTTFDTRGFAAEHGLGIEDAARRLRYGFFRDLCTAHGFSCVATAHHRDDSVETFFLNLFRGTGIAGLHGILPASNQGSMRLIRPMLCFSRQEIDSYVLQYQLEYVEDYTNSQLDVRRNRIRHQLMPLLRELYPSVDSTMEANMDRLHQVEQICDASIDNLFQRLLHSERSPFGIEYSYFRIDDLLVLDPLRPWLYAILRRFGFSGSVVGSLLAALVHRQTGVRFNSPSHQALVDRGRLLLAESPWQSNPPHVDVVRVMRDDLPPLGSGQQHGVEYVDADLVRQPLVVRRWQQGDRFFPLGMSHQRNLSDFLKDCKINRFEKDCIYVLVDADGRIVWVIGLRTDHRFRITDATQCALRLQVTGLDCLAGR